MIFTVSDSGTAVLRNSRKFLKATVVVLDVQTELRLYQYRTIPIYQVWESLFPAKFRITPRGAAVVYNRAILIALMKKTGALLLGTWENRRVVCMVTKVN